MSEDLELLLRASITIEAQKGRIAELETECADLRKRLVDRTLNWAALGREVRDLKRELGKWRLLSDIKEDACALLRRQAE
jgi:hypothetical protein